MHLKTIKNLSPTLSRVIMRVDFNIPIQDGLIQDFTRIQAAKASLDFLCCHAKKILLLAHLGRPKGYDPALSFAPHLQALSSCLNRDVKFLPTLPKDEKFWEDGQVFLLDNLRFWPEEESCDPCFSEKLSQLGQAVIQDAFSVCHRAHASTFGIGQHLPSYAGLFLEQEYQHLLPFVSLKSQRKRMVIVGGSKISSKIHVLQNLIPSSSFVAIVGAMANTFLKAQGLNIGKSLVEDSQLSTATDLLDLAAQHACQIILPRDVVVATHMQGENLRTCNSDQVQDSEMILDLGPQSVTALVEAAQQSQDLMWNGPLGMFEIPAFAQGSLSLARAIAKLTQEQGLISVAGGGDTLSLLNQSGHAKDFTYVSASGGAFLEFLEGKELPGLKLCLQ